MSDDYGGLLGAFPYAFRETESRLFRAYVVLGGLLAGVLAVGFTIAFVTAIANSVGLAAGGTSSFVRSFVVLVGFFVVLPLLAPVIFVARHHRRAGGTLGHDRALAATGFLYAVSLYLAAIISTPTQYQTADPGPVAAALYALPAIGGLIPPVLAAALVYLAHRRYR